MGPLYSQIALVGPVAFSIAMMVLVALGIGRLGNPLVLGYVVLVGYVLLGVLEGWEPRSEQRRGKERPRMVCP